MVLCVFQSNHHIWSSNYLISCRVLLLVLPLVKVFVTVTNECLCKNILHFPQTNSRSGGRRRNAARCTGHANWREAKEQSQKCKDHKRLCSYGQEIIQKSSTNSPAHFFGGGLGGYPSNSKIKISQGGGAGIFFLRGTYICQGQTMVHFGTVELFGTSFNLLEFFCSATIRLF